MNGDILGIIPAGGRAFRFGGMLKEFLPVGQDESLIDRAVAALREAGANRLLVITNEDKYPFHVRHLSQYQPYFIIQHSPEIWGAVQHSLEICGDQNIFVMPDTYFPVDAIPKEVTRHLGIGYFVTDKPERFGVIKDGQILDKQKHLSGRYPAWGILRWSNEIAYFWMRNEYRSLPEALTAAIQRYGYDGFKLDYYHDMATFEDYKRLICGLS